LGCFSSAARQSVEGFVQRRVRRERLADAADAAVVAVTDDVGESL
jgi:hypothetical protein